MTNEKEMTAPIVSVGADTEQSSQNLTNNSLTDLNPLSRGLTMVSTGKCKEGWLPTFLKRCLWPPPIIRALKGRNR